MVKQQELENNKRDDLDSSYDLSDTFLTQLFDSGPKTTQITKNDAIDTKSLSTSNLIHEQNNDPEIAILIQQAFDEKEISDQAMGYFIKNDILMRKWRPPDVSVDDEWSVRYQIVIPKPYREEVLRLAHKTPLSGHLGINKTYEKIIRHFYWPGVRKTVAEFCKTCHTCQVVGKPNQVIPKAPLKPIPAFEEPFSRIMIDCVGPLPKTKRGNQYLLTIMCVSTRFPEAIPLRNIKAKTIVEALTKFFTLVGLPKSIQSDQGSNFTSGLFQQIMHELGIKQYNSSAYHPESQGALE
ncbi:Transposon Ty3-I Gag-Pol poly, partial [Paramuricea clavata]